MHIQNTRIRHWIRERVEARGGKVDTSTPHHRILRTLHKAESFENFIHTTYVGSKRFSLEGGESMMVALSEILHRSPELGVKEIVLGMAGFYVLQALGLSATVYHLNEGHSAFMSLARIVDLRHRLGLTFAEAREACAMTTVFTTHTPVPAGFDIFSKAQLERFLPRIHEELGVDRATFLRLGAHENDRTVERGFNMAYCALRTAGLVNGVSLLHGEVSREMWQKMWPGLEADEVPIDGITNGIHTRTWLAPEIAALYDKYLGTDWDQHLSDRDYWRGVIEIPDRELWDTHQALK
jgi:starch phosphorylase